MLSALTLLAVVVPETGYTLDRSRIEIASAVFANEDTTALHPRIAGRLTVGSTWAIEADLPFATQLEGPATSGVGNLSFAGLARGYLQEVGRIEVGLGVTLPTARARTEADLETLDLATRMSGFFDLARYRPDTTSLTLPLRFESTSSEGLAFWGEGRPLLALPTDGDEVAGLLALTLGAGYRTRLAELRVDFGLAALFLPELDGVEGQLFVEPGLRLNVWRSESTVTFADVALRMNLDEPAGFAFEDGFYAVTVRLGVELPSLAAG